LEGDYAHAARGARGMTCDCCREELEPAWHGAMWRHDPMPVVGNEPDVPEPRARKVTEKALRGQRIEAWALETLKACKAATVPELVARMDCPCSWTGMNNALQRLEARRLVYRRMEKVRRGGQIKYSWRYWLVVGRG
jgi:hypothetical protein